MPINKDQKVLCICRNGQVRSVAARYILSMMFEFRKVIACGWELNDKDTVQMLYDWADVVLIVGRPSEWNLPLPKDKVRAIDIGPDIYGDYTHPALLDVLLPKIKALFDS